MPQVQRLPGMHSNMVALDCLLGTDETIDFQDFLGGLMRNYFAM